MSESKRTLHSAEDLAAAGVISQDAVERLRPVAARYALSITPSLLALIEPADRDDPIARQFVPSVEELTAEPWEEADPIGDVRHSPVEGVVHRYRDRVLLMLTHVCPVYCRFCFRRERVGPGDDQVLSAQALDAALSYIRERDEIWEVVLTGGDPFVLSPRRLAEVTGRLNEIAHVKVLRWHTRMPIADPRRITGALVEALKGRAAAYVAVHVNHERELSPEARRACARLVDAGIPMLSQTVLLKGVNDDPATLEALMRALVETRVKPYYLHHLDPAPGTSHFRLTIAEGRALAKELRARASGLCQPAYVLDIPGGHAKALLSESDAVCDGGGYRLRDGRGTWHSYSRD